MKSDPKAAYPVFASNPGDMLRQIADVLGVPVGRLYEPAAGLVLHAAPDGTRWLATRDDRGMPVIRRIGGPDASSDPIEESVATFLARDTDSPQHKALNALIDRLLAMHLAA